MSARAVPVPRIQPLHLSHLSRRVVFADYLPAEIHKCFVHIPSRPRGCFIIWGVVPGLGDLEGLGAGDGAVFFKVRFVADDDKGHERVIFDSNDLIAEFVEFGKGGQGGDAEDEEEALARFHI